MTAGIRGTSSCRAPGSLVRRAMAYNKRLDITSCAIITQAAGEPMRQIDDRQPVILDFSRLCSFEEGMELFQNPARRPAWVQRRPCLGRRYTRAATPRPRLCRRGDLPWPCHRNLCDRPPAVARTPRIPVSLEFGMNRRRLFQRYAGRHLMPEDWKLISKFTAVQPGSRAPYPQCPLLAQAFRTRLVARVGFLAQSSRKLPSALGQFRSFHDTCPDGRLWRIPEVGRSRGTSEGHSGGS